MCYYALDFRYNNIIDISSLFCNIIDNLSERSKKQECLIILTWIEGHCKFLLNHYADDTNLLQLIKTYHNY